jgi:lysophospholipase L1-like esterase
MKKLILLLFIPVMCFGQNNSLVSSEIKYYGKDFFRLEGTVIPDSLKENRYDRLPFSYKNIVRKPVWDLSKSSAGLSIRFLSNSTTISVKWKILNDFTMNHMAETGIKGVDLYYKNDNGWQYINTGRPQGIDNDYLLVDNMTEKLREFKIFLPLYDGVKNIEVGINSTSFIRKVKENTKKPIIFYGTSITQGGCASRPGMAHTNIISRKLDIDVVNFGFSGNGRMEQPIAELISETEPLFYVIECMPNMISAENISKTTIPLVNTIKKKNPDTPILFVDHFDFSFSVLDNQVKKYTDSMNTALKTEFKKMVDNGYENIFHLESKNALGSDYEGTVDGVHFTDLGFIRYADFLIERFKELKLID